MIPLVLDFPLSLSIYFVLGVKCFWLWKWVSILRGERREEGRWVERGERRRGTKGEGSEIERKEIEKDHIETGS